MADNKPGLTRVGDWSDSAALPSGLTPVESWDSPSASAPAVRFPEATGPLESSGFLGGMESLANYGKSFLDTAIINPARMVMNTPAAAGDIFYGEQPDPNVMDFVESLPIPGMSQVPDGLKHFLTAWPRGLERAAVDIANEGKPPEQRDATRRELWASSLGSLAALHPAVRAMRPVAQAGISYLGGRSAELATDRFNQETGAKPKVPLGEWAEEKAWAEPLNALFSLGGAAAFGHAAHKMTSGMATTGARGKGVVGNILDRDSSLAAAIVRTPEEGMIRIGGGERGVSGGRNQPLSEALRDDLPELKEALTSLGDAAKQMPDGQGTLFDDVKIANDNIRAQVATQLDEFYGRVPPDRTITYGDLIAPLRDGGGSLIGAQRKAAQSVYDDEITTAAQRVLTTPRPYRQIMRDADNRIVYERDANGDILRNRDGARIPRRETGVEPESVRFIQAFNRLNTREGRRGSQAGGVSNADRRIVRDGLRRISEAPIDIATLRDYDTQFSTEAKYKTVETSATGAKSAEAYEELADNARRFKYQLMEEYLSPEEFQEFQRANRKYSVSRKVNELLEKRIAEVPARGRAVGVPPIAIRDSETGQKPGLLVRSLATPGLLTDPEAMIRLSAGRNQQRSLDPVVLPWVRRGYSGMERIGDATGPVARVLNDPVAIGAIAANRTSNSYDPHPLRQVGEWLGNQAADGMQNIQRGVGMVGDMFSGGEPPQGAGMQPPVAQPPPPPLTAEDPMPRTVEGLQANPEAFLQRVMQKSGNPEVVSMVAQVMESPNKKQREIALGELAKQLPDLFEPAEYPSMINGKISDPVDRDEYERDLEEQLRRGEIDSLVYQKRVKAVGIDGTILRDPPQQIVPQGGSTTGPVMTTQGARRSYDY